MTKANINDLALRNGDPALKKIKLEPVDEIVILVIEYNENNDGIQGCSIDLDCFTPI